MITLAWMLFWRIGLAYVRFAQSVYPSNRIIRWAHRPGRVRYGWPLCGVLWFAYWRLFLWLQTLGPPDTADRPWWLYLATLAAAISASKFMGAFVFWSPPSPSPAPCGAFAAPPPRASTPGVCAGSRPADAPGCVGAHLPTTTAPSDVVEPISEDDHP